MQQDTLFGEMERPLTQNLYVYCLNNGVNLRDPSGNSAIDDAIASKNRYIGSLSNQLNQAQSALSNATNQPQRDAIKKKIDDLNSQLSQARREMDNLMAQKGSLADQDPPPPPQPTTPDWGDTSSPYNPVNNPSSMGSMLSGADSYWSSGSGNVNVNNVHNIVDEFAKSDTYLEDQIAKITFDKISSGGYFDTGFGKSILSRLSSEDANSVLALNEALQAVKGDTYLTIAIYNEMSRILGIQSVYSDGKIAKFKYSHEIFTAEDIKRMHQRDSIVFDGASFFGVGGQIFWILGTTAKSIQQNGEMPIKEYSAYAINLIIDKQSKKLGNIFGLIGATESIVFGGDDSYVEDGYRIHPGDSHTNLEIDYDLGAGTMAFDLYFSAGNFSHLNTTGEISLYGGGGNLGAVMNRWAKEGYIGR